MESIAVLLKNHPHWSAVETIYHRLSAKGYKAFLAGGCVRDALLGIPANDLDIASDATPEKIEELFEKTVAVGKSFGVMRVIIEGADIEVATFRNDGVYVDGRRPETVIFSSPEEDAERRDFTINALFFDMANENVLDFVHGQEDLQKRIIKTVGSAEKRFSEDKLRLLRAARFVAQLDFSLNAETFAAMKDLAPTVTQVSGERIRDEMGKLLKSSAVQKGLDVMAQSGLMQTLFPFRLRDNSWPVFKVPLLPQNELWQKFSLFFAGSDKAELKTALEQLKMATKDRRAIEDSWNLWQHPEDFFKRREGEKIQSLQKPGILWGLEILLQKNSFPLEIQKLLKIWNSLAGILPKPLLNGDDLQGVLKGEAIGKCLAEAYCLQLEEQIHDREEALIWLQNYLRKDS